jgi:myo-inositol-1(or 4)-monophosphatase
LPANNAAQDDLELIKATAEEAGRIAMRFFRKEPRVWYKGGSSPVTEADIAVDGFLRDTLLAARPDYGWLSEETEDDQSRLGDRPVFVVDPIDGTRAYVKGEDMWCVSVAVVRGGRTAAGVLACPARGELFTAGMDTKAHKNGAVISVAEPGVAGKIASSQSVFKKLPEGVFAGMERAAHVPSLAYRLAMVADGRLAATLVRPNANDWDLAAADLILSRAGGAVVDIDGGHLSYNRGVTTHGVLVAASVALLPSLRNAVRGIDL